LDLPNLNFYTTEIISKSTKSTKSTTDGKERVSPNIYNMIGGARRWLKRNRKGLAIGAGVLGAGYLAGQYVISKISEARERMSSDRIAKEK
jgi:hypothetical protein